MNCHDVADGSGIAPEAGKKPYGIDVAVLLIFFSRPGCFARVFEQVKLARPSRLFLYQDGPRDGEKHDADAEGIRRCREIALDIDWECEVHTNFQEKNVGCDPSEYNAQKWAFSYVEKCIILEDDDVPSQSFFPFCRELLDRYEHDERINMICGMNNAETWDTPYSYLFSSTGSIWGWATWRRVTDRWDASCAALDDPYYSSVLEAKAALELGGGGKNRTAVWRADRDSGVAHYETILGMGQFLNGGLNIVPAQNMINNIGNTPEGGTHSANRTETIPRGLRRIYTMSRFEIAFPLKHPPYVIDDTEFGARLARIMGTGHPWVQFLRGIEKTLLIIRYDGFGELFRVLRRRYGKN